MHGDVSNWSIDPFAKSYFVSQSVDDVVLVSANSPTSVMKRMYSYMVGDLVASMPSLDNYAIIVQPPQRNPNSFMTEFAVIGIPDEINRLHARIQELERALLVQHCINRNTI